MYAQDKAKEREHTEMKIAEFQENAEKGKRKALDIMIFVFLLISTEKYTD